MAQLDPSVQPSASSAVALPYPRPATRGVIKSTPDDFIVREQLGFEPCGEGEHLFVKVRKRGLTTHEMVNLLAEQVGIAPRHIGYSGLKDKHAVTEQWVSLHLPGSCEMPSLMDDEQIQVLAKQWHNRKLKTGVHRTNKFEIRVRDCRMDPDALESLAAQVREFGFANYFGEQRFGSQQDNVEQALRHLTNPHKSKRLTRTRRSLYLSSLRSFLFNEHLSMRITAGVWREPTDGDLFMLDGSRAIFESALDADIARRYAEHDIHCAIGLPGRGESRAQAAALEIEQTLSEKYAHIVELLKQQKVDRGHRAHRAIAHGLTLEHDREQGLLRLDVELERGVYFTSLLQHFIDFSSQDGH